MMQTYWATLWTTVRARIELLRRNPEAGYTTEAVIATALLALAAIAIMTAIIIKVTTKANSIDLQ